jgi:hypothetical protein
MKTRMLLIAFGMLVLLVPSCLPTDNNVNPDDPIAKFLGSWNVNESCRRMNYSVDIQADPGNSAQILIYNFGNPGPGFDPAVGLVVSNTVNVSTQNIGSGWSVSGKGTYLSNGNISWTYELFIPPSQYNCSATFTK